eukprot:CAMPEP_0119471928 /NCGR_PEP_ID=MMETSP1344-20130328/4194_1 /TAXON_ID=236787 /ORGANISM="Florenciella parvula, Strain CCMP2471" /LENGTH=152 /DNA_ID=CAMNT_0007504785 /DNA_START=13 /DNA_END=471 /DNA_ORIENTATION=+
MRSVSARRLYGITCRAKQELAKMPYTRFVEVGRVVLINYGPDAGKIAVIVDVVDGNKCLIDGPTTGVARQVIPYKRLALTDLMVEFEKGSHSKTIEGAMTASDVISKWETTSWAKKLKAKKTRASLNDFDRFKVMVARKQKAKMVADKMASM